jgi:transposase
MNISVLDIDIAKKYFYSVDKQVKALLKKKIKRVKFVEFMTQLLPCLIGMQACVHSHYWVRKFSAIEHTVKLMSSGVVS